ncbi:steroidogenic acute regulatory protein, mitochondrial [Chanos chanos]|uniref:START domain-containing protein 1 n=1 Tax=Chanos chanos TaxID=29144 RepID=A0A6J2VHG5_CHACN|nr:steroidogenic acute regulatory protein, mitochondrial-like [Chanos chanos]
MLPAVVKLCCGISYPHLRSMSGLQRTAIAALGQELAHMQRGGWFPLSEWTSHMRWPLGRDSSDAGRGDLRPIHLREEELSYVRQGQDSLKTALEIVEDKDGWKIEISEANGDLIYSKGLPGARKVFRLEAILDATPEELYEILFVKVEEMHQWNPNISQIKVLKHVGTETVVTHEISAETAGNLIGQRDFLSVRHSCKRDSCIYLGGAATQLESLPPQQGFVRAQDGPTCIILQSLSDKENSGKTHFTWLLNMDVKGWLPRSIVNQALPRAQVEFTRHLRMRLTAGPAQGGER